jgi:type III secretion system low calcium response chaperone LcrH/SycD
MENIEEFEIPEDVREKLQDPEYFGQQIQEGKSLQEILEFSDEKLEIFYQQASRLYQKNRFKESIEAFTFLTTLNPFVANFWLGLGMSEQRLEEYSDALLAFAMAMMADPASPLPHYQTALCYRAMGEKESALGALELALMRSGDNEWQHLKEKIIHLKSIL